MSIKFLIRQFLGCAQCAIWERALIIEEVTGGVVRIDKTLGCRTHPKSWREAAPWFSGRYAAIEMSTPWSPSPRVSWSP